MARRARPVEVALTEGVKGPGLEPAAGLEVEHRIPAHDGIARRDHGGMHRQARRLVQAIAESPRAFRATSALVVQKRIGLWPRRRKSAPSSRRKAANAPRVDPPGT
jgi:hypothetical protein